MDYRDIFITRDYIIKDAIQKLDETGKKILFVVENEKLFGALTDGDIRRWILKNGDLNEEVSKIMNQSPVTLSIHEQDKAIILAKEKCVNAIPILSNSRVVKIKFLDNLFDENKKGNNKINNSVVIMAGGKGTRLYPYTKILPKPLIPIGDTPIIERIVNKFNEFGCEDFYLTVNYKKNMIKTYFEDLDKKYLINYVEEDKPLGTGGSLSLLKAELSDTFFLSNCDVMIDAEYDEILKYHKENKNRITIVASLKHTKIPYGVIRLNDDGTMNKIDEKPELNHLVNTGMYILEPEVIEKIPEDTFYHITELIEKCNNEGVKVGVFPVSENSWMDMGEIEEMNNMIKKLEITK